MFEDDKTTGVEQITENSEAVAATQDSSAAEPNALEKFMLEMDAAENEADSKQEQAEPEQSKEPEAKDNAVNELPKGIKGRIQAAETKAEARGYERGKAEAQREFEAIKADYEKRIAKTAEIELENDAKELAQKEKCSIELARRILRMERGMAQSVSKSEADGAKPRDEKGRFTPQEQATDDVHERAQTLYDQAKAVQKSTGIDVLSLFAEDEGIKRAIVNGEMDFKDVALQQLMSNTPKPKTPRPVNSGGAEANSRVYSFKNMTDEEFRKFDERLARGAVVHF